MKPRPESVIPMAFSLKHLRQYEINPFPLTILVQLALWGIIGLIVWVGWF